MTAIEDNSYNRINDEIVTIDDAVDRIGLGKFQLQVLFATGTCFMADSMEVMLLSFLSRILQKEWDFDEIQGANIPSSLFAGALVGTLILGPLGDRIGRKPILYISASTICLFGFSTACCNGYYVLLTCLFMVGFGVGGLTVPFDILAEYLPSESRGSYLMAIKYFWTLGAMLIPVVAYLTIELVDSWRLFVAVSAIPCFISLIVGVLYVPESPRWLVSKGNNVKALRTLRRAASINGLDPKVTFPDDCVLLDEKEEEVSLAELFTPKWRKLTIILWLIWGGYAMSYYVTIMTVTKVFEVPDNGNEDDAPDFDYVGIFIASSAEILGISFVLFMVDRIGRIGSQVAAFSLGGITFFLLCLFSDRSNHIVEVSLAFCTRACAMAGSSITWISTAELLSTEIRATGHSAANAVGRIGGFTSSYLVATVGSKSLPELGFIMLAVNIFIAFCASKLPETQGVTMGKATLMTDASGEWIPASESWYETKTSHT